MISFRHIPLLFLVLFSAPSLVFAATLQELQDLVDKEKFDDAYLMAQTMSQTQMGTADFDYLYGLISRNAGHPEVAVFAYERVLMLNPADARTMYEHGRALIEVNDLQGAAQEFKNVLGLKTITPDLKTNTVQVLGLVEEALRALDRSTTFAVTAEFQTGFNSNVNSGTSGPPVFPIQEAEIRDGFVNLGATALIKRMLSKDWHFYVAFAADNRKNFQSVTWDSNAFTAAFGTEIDFHKITLRLPFSGEVTLTGYVLDRVIAGLAPEVSYAWSDQNFSTLSVGFGTKLFTADSANNYFTFPITLSHWTASLVKGAGLAASFNYTPGLSFRKPNISTIIHDEVSLSLSASIEVASAHFLSPALTVMYLHYPNNLALNGTRDDANITAQITYEWHFTQHWSLAPSFSFNYGYSTDAGETYFRYQPLVGLRYQL